MGLVDFTVKGVESIKAKIQNLNLGLNTEETKYVIDLLDQSTHVHYHAEVGLPHDVILSLPAEEVGLYIQHQSFLVLKAALRDKPEQLAQLIAKYDVNVLAAGTAAVVANVAIPHMTTEPSSTPSASSSSSSSSSSIPIILNISSGDLIDRLPKIIQSELRITPPS